MKTSFFLFLACTCLFVGSNAQWQQTNSPTYSQVNSLAVSGNNLFAGLHVGSVHISSDGGETWNATNLPITFSLKVYDNILYTAIDNLVHISKDNGQSYETLNIGLPDDCNAYYIEVLEDLIMVETENNGTVISTNNGESWTAVAGMYGLSCLIQEGDSLFSATGNGVKLSTDGGLSWNTIGLADAKITSLLVKGERMLAGTYSDGIYLSDDKGSTWIPADTDLSSTYIGSLIVHGSAIYAAAGSEGVVKSTDNGVSWEQAGSGFPDGTSATRIASMNNTIFAGTNSCGMFRKSDDEIVWTQSSKGLGKPASIISMVAKSERLIAGTSLCGLYISENDGADWTLSNIAHGIYTLLVEGDTIYAGTTNGVYLSADEGDSWEHIGLTNKWVTAITVTNNRIFAGTEKGVFQSTDVGLSWTEANTGIPENTHIYCLASQGSTLYAGSFDSGVHLSTDYGESWTAIGSALPYTYVKQLLVQGSTLYASVWWNGVYRTDNNGATWSAAGLQGKCVTSFAFSGDTLLASTWTDGVFSSPDQGISWRDLSSGMSDQDIQSMALQDNNLFIGLGQEGGIWKHSFSPPERINTLNQHPDFNIFPCPARDQIYINAPDQQTNSYTLRIYTSNGVLIDSKLISESNSLYDLSDFNPGVYLFQIQTEKEILSRKVVVQ